MTPDEFAALAPGSRVCWAGLGNERLPGTVVAVTPDGVAVRWDDDAPGCRPAEYLELDAGSLRAWPVPEPPPEPPGLKPGRKRKRSQSAKDLGAVRVATTGNASGEADL